MTPSWAEIARRIGGRYGISWKIFALGSPFWMFGFFFNEQATYTSSSNALVLLGLSAAGQIIMGLVLWLAHLTVARNRKTRPVAVGIIVAVWSLSAIARMAFLYFGMQWFGLPDDVPFPIRLGTAIGMAIVGYGLGAYAFDAFDRYREERAQLLSRLLEEEELLSRHRDTIDTMQSALVSQVDKELSDSQQQSLAALTRLEESLASEGSSRPALQELRELSDHTWQRISQDLWSKAPQRPPRIKGSELLALWARSDPFNVPILSILAVFLYALVYSRVFDPVVGAIVTVTWLGLVVLFSFAANAVLSRLGVLTTTVFTIFITILLFSSLPLLAMFQSIGVTTTEWVRAIAVHFISIGISFVVSLPPAVARSRQNVLDTLRASISESNLEKLHVESRLAIVSQKIANKLHGDVRGNFLAAMLNLQAQLDKGNITQAQATISDIKKLMSQSLSVAESSQNQAEELESFLHNWSAIIDVSMDRPLSSLPTAFHSALHLVVVDAVNNAVRHGEADWIRIETREEEDALILIIRNNGKPLTGERQGLGTANLNALAPGQWSRIPLSDGMTQLTVRLELSRLPAPSPLGQ